MPVITKLFLLFGGLALLLAVIFGAFGAHILKKSLSPDSMAVYETAVQYHFYHALGLLAVALLTVHLPSSSALQWSGWMMIAGIVIFSGSLYVLSIIAISWLGAITPIGGTAFIVAWLLFIVAVLKAT
jgi:uncharacterized membrane protein YgdD (TMEM256/DUF423 family)